MIILHRFLAAALAALAFGPAAAFAQVRDSVCVVSPSYPDSTLAFARRAAESFKKKGYDDAAKTLESFSRNSFGSGFVCLGRDGKAFIVTNRHVVVDADRADVEIEDAAGKKATVKDCPVVYVDDDLDLALLALAPDTDWSARALPLSPLGVEDGQEVWSAGYPGLAGSPSWQLGKGTVTNSAARIAELVDPAKSSLLQHSAPVDPGNSGGPLLVADKGSPKGYAVVGVNTWKARSRQATNFALPAATLRGVLDRSASGSKTGDGADLERRAKEFAAAMADKSDNKYQRLSRFIGFAYVEAKGPDALLNVLSRAPSEVRADVVETFRSAPFEAMRLAVAYELAEQSGKSELKLGAAPAAEPANGAAELAATLGTETVALPWKLEYRSWRLGGFGASAPAAQGKEATAGWSHDSPYRIVLAWETTSAGDGVTLNGGNIVGMLSDRIGIGASIVAKETETDDGYGESTQDLLVRTGGVGRLQYPFTFNRGAFVPYIELGAGLQIDQESTLGSGFYARAMAGLQFCFGGTLKLVAGCAGGYDTMSTDASGSDGKARDSWVYSVWLGLAL